MCDTQPGRTGQDSSATARRAPLSAQDSRGPPFCAHCAAHFILTNTFTSGFLGKLQSLGSLHKFLLWFSLEIMSGSFVIPWTIVLQTPLSMGFPRQEYQSGLPFPSPGDLPDLGIEPASPALAGIHGFSFHQTVPPSSVPGTS